MRSGAFFEENIFTPDDLNEFTEKLRAALYDRLPKTDPSRLKTTQVLGSELVQELNSQLSSHLQPLVSNAPKSTYRET